MRKKFLDGYWRLTRTGNSRLGGSNSAGSLTALRLFPWPSINQHCDYTAEIATTDNSHGDRITHHAAAGLLTAIDENVRFNCPHNHGLSINLDSIYPEARANSSSE